MKALRMAVLTLGAAVLVSATALLATPEAAAQQMCLIRDDAIEQLGKKHGETVTARGLTQKGRAMIELLTSEQGSWTLVITDVNGRSCIIGVGEAWQSIKVPQGVAS
ncbi:MAG: hypothetical protein ACR2Q4_07145 [Geminicoccaceae bacterium]